MTYVLLVEVDICTQVLKLSDEICIVPEQVVSEVLVLNVELSIGSEKVTEMLEVEDTDVVVSAGETDDTVGAVVSIPPFVPAIIYLSKVSSFLAHEYTNSRISPEIRLVFIIDLSEKETDTK